MPFAAASRLLDGLEGMHVRSRNPAHAASRHAQTCSVGQGMGRQPGAWGASLEFVSRACCMLCTAGRRTMAPLRQLMMAETTVRRYESLLGRMGEARHIAAQCLNQALCTCHPRTMTLTCRCALPGGGDHALRGAAAHAAMHVKVSAAYKGSGSGCGKEECMRATPRSLLPLHARHTPVFAAFAAGGGVDA